MIGEDISLSELLRADEEMREEASSQLENSPYSFDDFITSLIGEEEVASEYNEASKILHALADLEELINIVENYGGLIEENELVIC